MRIRVLVLISFSEFDVVLFLDRYPAVKSVYFLKNLWREKFKDLKSYQEKNSNRHRNLVFFIFKNLKNLWREKFKDLKSDQEKNSNRHKNLLFFIFKNLYFPSNLAGWQLVSSPRRTFLIAALFSVSEAKNPLSKTT